MPQVSAAAGIWQLTRYEEVYAALRDVRFGRKGFHDLVGGIDPPMQFQDPPAHTRLRNLIGSVFTWKLVESLRPRVQRIASQLGDRACAGPGLDVIAAFARPLSVAVIAELMGVPAADHPRFERWSLEMTEGVHAICASEAYRRGIQAHQELASYLNEVIVERRRRPQADLVSRLITAEQGGSRLSESELLDVCGLLFVAGHETTINLIGNGLVSLLLHPTELRRLREDPGLIVPAVEELLRFESPVQRIGRMTNQEIEIGGRRIPQGAVVSVMIGAANRDPAHCLEPDRLDIGRWPNRHLAFGHGVHACIGAPLARMKGQIAIGTLLRRCPGMALREQAPQWRQSGETRGLKELHVTM